MPQNRLPQFTRSMDLQELGSLLEQAYKKRKGPVEIAFEDVDFPELICRGAVLHRNGATSRLCLVGKVLDMLGEKQLPMGTLSTKYTGGYKDRKPFSAYLVYDPVS